MSNMDLDCILDNLKVLCYFLISGSLSEQAQHLRLPFSQCHGWRWRLDLPHQGSICLGREVNLPSSCHLDCSSEFRSLGVFEQVTNRPGPHCIHDCSSL